MSQDTLDEDLLFSHSNNPKIGKVNSTAWLKECQQLERKFYFGLLIILFISGLSTLFAGFLIFFAMLLFCGSLFITNLRKFAKLKSLVDHQFILKETEIIEIGKSEKRIFQIDQLKDIQNYNWGIEITKKSKSDESNKMMIPKQLPNFKAIQAALKIKP